MSKFVRIIENGIFEDYSPQDLIHNDVNQFKNWKCSAGSEGLFIDWDGIVWPATCEIGKEQSKLGSLKDNNPIKLLEDYITCNHKYCPCLVEIYLPKYKKLKKQLSETQLGNVNLKKFSAVTRASEFDRDRKYIMWAFGRKCNFSCSYCDDNSHSKLDQDLVTEFSIEKALQYAEQFRQGKSIMWSFTGGEPTINPLFLDLVKYLKAKGDTITVATNGSASHEYYNELAQVANINISVHYQFLKPAKLRKVCTTIVNAKPDWFGLNFMIMPGMAETTYKYFEQVKDIPGFLSNTTLNFDILRKKNTELYEIYSQKDMDLIKKLQTGAVDEI